MTARSSLFEAASALTRRCDQAGTPLPSALDALLSADLNSKHEGSRRRDGRSKAAGLQQTSGDVPMPFGFPARRSAERLGIGAWPSQASGDFIDERSSARRGVAHRAVRAVRQREQVGRVSLCDGSLPQRSRDRVLRRHLPQARHVAGPVERLPESFGISSADLCSRNQSLVKLSKGLLASVQNLERADGGVARITR